MTAAAAVSLSPSVTVGNQAMLGPPAPAAAALSHRDGGSLPLSELPLAGPGPGAALRLGRPLPVPVGLLCRPGAGKSLAT